MKKKLVNSKPISVVDGLQTIVVTRGVKKQVGVYHLDGVLHANVSGGYVTLYAGGNTSKPDTLWLSFIYNSEVLPIDKENTSMGFLHLDKGKM